MQSSADWWHWFVISQWPDHPQMCVFSCARVAPLWPWPWHTYCEGVPAYKMNFLCHKLEHSQDRWTERNWMHFHTADGWMFAEQYCIWQSKLYILARFDCGRHQWASVLLSFSCRRHVTYNMSWCHLLSRTSPYTARLTAVVKLS